MDKGHKESMSARKERGQGTPERGARASKARVTLDRRTASRQKVETALRESEARLRAIVESAGDGIITIDERAIIESVNPACERLFGYATGELAGQNLKMLMPSPFREAHDEYLARYLKTRVARVIGGTREAAGCRRDGSVFPIELTVSEVDLAGRHVYIGIVRDITERRRAEAALREAELRYRTLFEQSPDALVALDAETTLPVEFNDKACQELGYSRAEFARLRIRDYNANQSPDEIQTHVAQVLRRGHGEFQVKHRTRQGAIRDVRVTARTLELAGRRVLHCIWRDITEEAQAKAALDRLSRLQELILNSAGEGILGLDREGRMTFVNRAAAQLLGHPIEKLLGQPSHKTWHHTKSDGSPYPEKECPILATLQDGQVHGQTEDVFWQSDGAELAVEYLSNPIREGGKPAGAVVIFRDITERKRLEKEILRISEAEQCRIGQDLHDSLCQQLAGIEFRLHGLQANLAKKSKPAAATAAEIGRLTRQAIKETRRLARGLSPVSLQADGLMAALQELAANAEHLFQISCRFQCAAPVLLQDSAVANHLYRIAQEAVSNSVKHGKALRVVIRLLADRGRIVLAIKDDGRGFAEAPSDHHGMGLRVMQYRAGVIGATLDVQSSPKGTKVTCSLESAPHPARAMEEL